MDRDPRRNETLLGVAPVDAPLLDDGPPRRGIRNRPTLTHLRPARREPGATETHAHESFEILQRVVRLLERAEGTSETGLLLLGEPGAERGGFVMCGGRVGYVNDPRQPSLHARITEIDDEAARALQRAAREAVAQKRSVGELLASDLPLARRALLTLCTMSLVSVAHAHMDDEAKMYTAASKEVHRWTEHWFGKVADYDQRLCFSTLDVCQAVAAALDDTPACAASRFFELSRDVAATSLLLWRDPARAAAPLPLDTLGVPAATIGLLRKLAHGAQLLQLPSIPDEGATRMVGCGDRFNELLLVSSPRRLALAYGAGVAARAQLANAALKACETSRTTQPEQSLPRPIHHVERSPAPAALQAAARKLRERALVAVCDAPSGRIIALGEGSPEAEQQLVLAALAAAHLDDATRGGTALLHLLHVLRATNEAVTNELVVRTDGFVVIYLRHGARAALFAFDADVSVPMVLGEARRAAPAMVAL